MTSRIIILGASNVTRGLGGLVAAAIASGGSGPCDVFIAAGHGRSYGTRSRVLGRELPGIIECGLWDQLSPPSLEGRGQGGGSKSTTFEDDPAALTSRASPTPHPPPSKGGGTTFALITDIGNDIMYGRSAEEIAGWVGQSVARIRESNPKARLAMSAIPIEVIRTLSPRRYAIFKALLFPSRELKYPQAMERAEELHQRLIDLAAKNAIAPSSPIRGWYGWDPVHPRRKHLRDVWKQYLAGWSSPELEAACDGECRLVDRLRLRLARARDMTWLGLQLGRAAVDHASRWLARAFVLKKIHHGDTETRRRQFRWKET